MSRKHHQNHLKNHIEDQNKSCSMCATDIFEEKPSFWKQRKTLIIAVSAVLLSVGLYMEFFTGERFIAQFIFAMVVLVSGYDIAKDALRSLLKIRLNMDFLIIVAAIGAFFIGHGEEGAAVVFLFFIAEFLEDYAGERVRRSIASLLKLTPETAIVKRDGKEVEVHVHEIKPREIVVLKPGDKIPLDGKVLKGTSTVNQAPITGESIPVLKKKGDSVYAGTINETGYLEFRVTKASEETLLSKIIKLVEKAQKQKSETEKFIDRFAKYYTPTVILLALGVMFLPTLLFGWSFREWFYRGLVLLVISCPCALAISTPVSIVSGLTSGARNGVLIKAGRYLEEIRNARVLVFDKTGTLTKGKPVVTDIIPLDGYREKDVLQIAASLEAKSKHPLAEAIIEEAKRRNLELKRVENFESITGEGIKGEIDEGDFYVGNRSFLRKMKANFNEELVEKLESQGKTVIFVGSDSQFIGMMAVMDEIRKEARETIGELKKSNILPVMLTGDNKKAAKGVAENLGIEKFYAELLPQDKVKIVEDLLSQYEHVVVVGDGVNDAPALAKAHVGIAMGVIGSDVAIETADIALMNDDISSIKYLIKLSRKTMSVVRQNIAASILIKGSFAILAFPGLISLWLAVAIGDMGLSLAVILNALRLAKVGKN